MTLCVYKGGNSELKTVTIKLRIHKLLAEKRLTKYRFIAMTGLGYKNASRILDNETESIRFSTIARICSALDCTPGDLFEVHGCSFSIILPIQGYVSLIGSIW